MAVDNTKVTLLSLLEHLKVAIGIGDTVPDWIWSFLSGCTQQVVYGGEQAVTSAVLFGVPQDTVLGPLLHILYTAPLLDIIAQHRVNAHQYTDDLQLYICILGWLW